MNSRSAIPAGSYMGSTTPTPGTVQPQTDPLDQLLCSARCYIRENPESAALWCLGIGFVLGWKLKPW
jgi:hypothetical protein